jgi:hypothetical protein
MFSALPLLCAALVSQVEIRTSSSALSLEAPAELEIGVRAGILRERPEVQVLSRAAEGVLAVRIYAQTSGWRLNTRLRDRLLDERQLGAEKDAAVRLAVLLIVERLRDLPREEEPPRFTATSTAALIEAPPGPTITPTTSFFRFELTGDFDTWSEPLTFRPGIALGAFIRFDRWLLGVRGRTAGPWGSIDGDGVSAETSAYSVVAEASYALAFGFSAKAAAGAVVYEQVTAQSEVFVGPGLTEELAKEGALFRLGLGFEPGLSETFDLTFALGIEALTSSFLIRLPPPYDAGRVPLDRGTWSPFFSAGVAVDL